MKRLLRTYIAPTGSNFANRTSAILPAVVVCLAILGGLAAATVHPSRWRDDDACKSNLKQYALGILMYVQDYDERFPPTKLAAQTENRVYPYVKNRNVFKCASSGESYTPNPALNYVFLSKVKSPAQLVLLRDSKPHKSDSGTLTWNVAYVDGHVKTVTTEPKLGKLAPTPKPLTRLQQVQGSLATLKNQRKQIDAEIAKLEAEKRKLKH